jgi:hypothetical protein
MKKDLVAMVQDRKLFPNMHVNEKIVGTVDPLVSLAQEISTQYNIKMADILKVMDDSGKTDLDKGLNEIVQPVKLIVEYGMRNYSRNAEIIKRYGFDMINYMAKEVKKGEQVYSICLLAEKHDLRKLDMAKLIPYAEHTEMFLNITNEEFYVFKTRDSNSHLHFYASPMANTELNKKLKNPPSQEDVEKIIQGSGATQKILKDIFHLIDQPEDIFEIMKPEVRTENLPMEHRLNGTYRDDPFAAIKLTGVKAPSAGQQLDFSRHG